MAKKYIKRREIFEKWGLTNEPNLDELIKFPELYDALFVERDYELSEFEDQLESNVDNKIKILAGNPGVGKSTFLDYVEKKIFTGRMKRVSLIKLINVENDWGYTEFSEEQFIYIFGEVYNFLNEIISKEKLKYETDTKTPFDKNYFRADTRLPFSEYTRDIIIPLCKIINDQKDKIQNKYYLAIDDVDYIFPYQQKDFLSVLCSMASETFNPQIIYSARPVAAGVAIAHITTFNSHMIGNPYFLGPLNALNIIKQRFSVVARDPEAYYFPFNNDESRKLINSLSCGNLRETLKIGVQVIDKINTYMDQDFKISYINIIECLYGNPSRSINSSRETEINRRIFNVFFKYSPSNSYPLFYVLLACLTEERIIDESFYNDVNKFINEMVNDRVLNDQVLIHIKEDEILDGLVELRKSYLIQRLNHNDFDHIPDDKNEYSPKKRLIFHLVGLTSRGDYILKLIHNIKYLELTKFEEWRSRIREFVNERKLFTTVDSNMTFLKGEYERRVKSGK